MAAENDAGEQIDPVILAQRVRKLPEEYRECVDLMKCGNLPEACVQLIGLGEAHVQDAKQYKHIIGTLEAALKDKNEKEVLLERTQNALEAKISRMETELRHLRSQNEAKTAELLLLKQTAASQSMAMDETLKENFEKLQRGLLERDTEIQRLQEIITSRDRVIATSQAQVAEQKRDLQLMHEINEKAIALSAKVDACIRERANLEALLVEKDTKIQELHTVIMDMGEQSLREKQSNDLAVYKRVATNSVSLGPDLPLEKSIRFSTRIEVIEEGENGKVERKQEALNKRKRKPETKVLMGDLEGSKSAISTDIDYESESSDSSNDITKEKIHRKPIIVGVQTDQTIRVHKIIQTSEGDDKELIIELKRALLIKIREIYKIKLGLGIVDTVENEILRSDLFSNDVVESLLVKCQQNGLWEQDIELMRAMSTNNYRPASEIDELQAKKETQDIVVFNAHAYKSLVSLLPVSMPDSLWEIKCNQAMMRQNELESKISQLTRLNTKLCSDLHAIIAEQDHLYTITKDNNSKARHRSITSTTPSKSQSTGEENLTVSSNGAVIARMNAQISSILNPPLSSGHGAHLLRILNSMIDSKKTTEFFYDTAVRYRSICFSLLEQLSICGIQHEPDSQRGWASNNELSLLISNLTAARNRIVMLAEKIDELSMEKEMLQHQVDLQTKINLQDLSSLTSSDSTEGLYARCMVAEGLASVYSSLLLKGHGLRCKELEESLRLFNEENDLLLTRSILQNQKQSFFLGAAPSNCTFNKTGGDSFALQLAFQSIKKCASTLLEGEASYRVCNSLALIVESETLAEYKSRLATTGIICDEIPPPQVSQYAKSETVPARVSAVENARKTLAQQQAWGNKQDGKIIIRPSERLQAELQACFAESKVFNNSTTDDKKADLRASKLRLQAMKSRISSLCEALGEIIVLPPLTDASIGDFPHLKIPFIHNSSQGSDTLFHQTLQEDVSVFGNQEDGMIILTSSKRIVNACERRIATLEQLNTELADRIYREINRLISKLGTIRFICCRKDKIRTNLANVRSLYTQALRSFKETEQNLQKKLDQETKQVSRLEEELSRYASKATFVNAEIQCEIWNTSDYNTRNISLQKLKDEKKELLDQALGLQTENIRLQEECKDANKLRNRLQKLYNAYLSSSRGCKLAVETYIADVEACLSYHKFQAIQLNHLRTNKEHTTGANDHDTMKQLDLQDLLLSEVQVPVASDKVCNTRLGEILGRILSKLQRMTDRFDVLHTIVLQLQRQNADLRRELSTASLATNTRREDVLGKPSSSLQIFSESTGEGEKLSLSLLDLVETANGPMSSSSLQNLMKNKIKLLQEGLLAAKKQVSELTESINTHSTSSIGCQVSMIGIDAAMESSIPTPTTLHFVKPSSTLRGSSHLNQTVTVSMQTMTLHLGYKLIQTEISHLDVVARSEYEELANKLQATSTLTSKIGTSIPPDVALSLYNDSIINACIGVGTQTPHLDCQDCKTMQNTLTAAQIEIEELKEEIKMRAREAECELSQVQTKLDSAMESIRTKVDKCNMLERLLTEEKARVQDFLQQISDMKEREHSHENAISNIKLMLQTERANQLAKKDKKLAELQKNLEGVITANDKLQAKNRALHTEVVRLKKDLDTRRSMQSKSSAGVAKTEELEALNKELTIAKSRIRTLVAELRMVKQSAPQQNIQSIHPVLQPSPRLVPSTSPLRPYSARASPRIQGNFSKHTPVANERPTQRARSAESFVLSRGVAESDQFSTRQSRYPTQYSPKPISTIEQAVTSELRNIDYMIEQYKKYPDPDDLAVHNIYHEPTSGLIIDESDRRHLLGALSDEDISAILTM